MSAYNMGEKTCQEYGCVCWDCEYRNSRNGPKECRNGVCKYCDPDLPLDYDGEDGEYGGTSKCSCYQQKGEQSMEYRKTVEHLREKAEIFKKSNYAVDGVVKCFEESADTIEQLAEELKQFKDKQEQGLLIELPCGIGADIYQIPSDTNFRLNLLHGHGEINRVYHQKVFRITIHDKGWYMEGDKDHEYGISRLFLDVFYGATWFLTEAEAEEALAKMGGK